MSRYFSTTSYTFTSLILARSSSIDSRQPENSFFDDLSNPLFNFEGPLFTLSSIKTDWMNHLTTCINISSADILQFAIFFATTRQKDTPESLLLHSASPPSAIAKRETFKNDFRWGRPDELNCDPAWTDNLPGPNTFACNGNIPCRCAMAGDEIQEKMMNRNGFTAGKFQFINLLTCTILKI